MSRTSLLFRSRKSEEDYAGKTPLPETEWIRSGGINHLRDRKDLLRRSARVLRTTGRKDGTRSINWAVQASRSWIAPCKEGRTVLLRACLCNACPLCCL